MNNTEGGDSMDLTHDELVYLIQLVNSDFCNKQRKNPGMQTPFECTVYDKLYTEMETKREATPSTGDSVPEVGGMIVEVGGLKMRVGPEAIEAFRLIEAEKQKAIASGKPSLVGQWQTHDPKVTAIIKTVAEKAGFPDLFGE
jgi:hypothetical protein